MASSRPNVIVFGASGAVGCAASREAHRRGASVWLAMRDTSKSISGLDSSEPGYTRIQADLSDPLSVARAIQQSSATVAFVYTIFASQDHMASTFATLKSAGIVYVVLLSSFSVRGAAHEAANMGNFIARVHAKAEVALGEAKIAFAAIRPAYFNSNVFWNREDIKNGEAGLLYPEVRFDARRYWHRLWCYTSRTSIPSTRRRPSFQNGISLRPRAHDSTPCSRRHLTNDESRDRDQGTQRGSMDGQVELYAQTGAGRSAEGAEGQSRGTRFIPKGFLRGSRGKRQEI
jgi:hypothetical protein